MKGQAAVPEPHAGALVIPHACDRCPPLFYPHAGAMRSDALVIGIGAEQTARAIAVGRRRVDETYAKPKTGTLKRYGADGRFTPAERAALNADGAGAEIAVALALGVEWTGQAGIGAPDAGPYEVRQTRYSAGRLILHPKDDEAPYILVTGTLPTFVLRGWLYAHEARAGATWWRTPPEVPYPAFFVPQEALHSMARLNRERSTFPSLRPATGRPGGPQSILADEPPDDVE